MGLERKDGPVVGDNDPDPDPDADAATATMPDGAGEVAVGGDPNDERSRSRPCTNPCPLPVCCAATPWPCTLVDDDDAGANVDELESRNASPPGLRTVMVSCCGWDWTMGLDDDGWKVGGESESEGEGDAFATLKLAPAPPPANDAPPAK